MCPQSSCKSRPVPTFLILNGPVSFKPQMLQGSPAEHASPAVAFDEHARQMSARLFYRPRQETIEKKETAIKIRDTEQILLLTIILSWCFSASSVSNQTTTKTTAPFFFLFSFCFPSLPTWVGCENAFWYSVDIQAAAQLWCVGAGAAGVNAAAGGKKVTKHSELDSIANIWCKTHTMILSHEDVMIMMRDVWKYFPTQDYFQHLHNFEYLDGNFNG